MGTTDRERANGMPDGKALQSVTLTAPDSDEDLFRNLTHAARTITNGDGVLLIDGSMDAPLTSGAHRWIALLADLEALPVVVADGPVAARGLALLLLADLAIIGAGARFVGPPAPLPEVAHLRLGQESARRFAFADDPVECLLTLGQCRRAERPMPAAMNWIKRAVPAGLPRRLRQGWRAARDLPASEALAFAAWFDRLDPKEQN